MANQLLRERGAPPVGPNWTTKFIKRQPAIRTRYVRKYDYKRAMCEDLKLINAWFALVRNVKAKYGILDEDVYNFDETGFMIGQIRAGMVVTTSDGLTKAKLAQPGNREWATVIQGVNAMGWAIPPFIILAAQRHQESWYRESGLPGDWCIETTNNGWTTNEVGLQWARHFDRHTKARTKGTYRLLILDGHESHHSTAFELFCKEHHIITLCMPLHSSHILQPLDVGCFGPLKQAYGREIEALMRASICHVTKLDFLCGFREAFHRAITATTIRGGFRGAGIVPYDPESVISRLDIQPRTPSPPPLPPMATTTTTTINWASATPHTLGETTSQADLIRGRIVAHQGSSPTSLLMAVDQLAKGTVVVMHQVALLRTEVSSLRKANIAISKRRKAKLRYLKDGGDPYRKRGYRYL